MRTLEEIKKSFIENLNKNYNKDDNTFYKVYDELKKEVKQLGINDYENFLFWSAEAINATDNCIKLRKIIKNTHNERKDGD